MRDANGVLAIIDVIFSPRGFAVVCAVILVLILVGIPMLQRPLKRRR